MEDVLEVYQRKPDAARPLVCIDEFCKQLLSEVAPVLPPEPGNFDHDDAGKGKRERYDSEYVREGSVSAFMIAMPHEGKRRVFVGKEGKRKAVDYADAIEFLCDTLYPEAEKIILVQDNLNIHETASLYKRFEPAKARRLAAKLEIHYTPKHGSWLNMAEIEISLLARSALKKRIPNQATLEKIVSQNVARRNKMPKPIQWQFTNKKARIKLKRLYPQISLG